MTEWVVCPIVLGGRRGDTREPAIQPYAHGSVLGGTKTVCVVKVLQWLDRPAAVALPNVLPLDSDQLDTTVTSQRAAQINNFLAQRTDLLVTVSAGDTLHAFLQRIATELGHTNAFDPSLL